MKFPVIATELLEKAGFKVTCQNNPTALSQDNLIRYAKENDALFCTMSDKINNHFLNECAHLDFISQFAAGYDNIDIIEATKLGIPISNTPDATTNATADIAFGLMIAVSRKMFFLHKTIQKGKWDFFRPTENLGIELRDKTLGVFGLGKIGLEMASLCKKAYDMKIIYHNRKPNSQAEQILGATYVDFNSLLKESDIISLHCSLNETTKGVFNKSAFEQMKPSAIFINTSRGPVHNEQDLIDALKAGKIWGVGLDVTNPEPMNPNNPLLEMENVCVMPHVGSGTFETRDEMARIAATNIIEWYQNQNRKNVII